MMKETGIIFSTALVPQVLDGTKTVTRRLYGLERANLNPDAYHSPFPLEGFWVFHKQPSQGGEPLVTKCPYGGVGDELYVKEGWAITGRDSKRRLQVAYRADSNPDPSHVLLPIPADIPLKARRWIEVNQDDQEKYGDFFSKYHIWCSSLFMPKWASRIWLEIVSVRPERLQKITEEDCLKEGLKKRGFNGSALFQTDGFADDICFVGYDLAFKQLWDSLNPKHPWDTNPWVWRIEFKIKREGGKCGI